MPACWAAMSAPLAGAVGVEGVEEEAAVALLPQRGDDGVGDELGPAGGGLVDDFEAQAALVAMRQLAGTRAAQLREAWISPMLT